MMLMDFALKKIKNISSGVVCCSHYIILSPLFLIYTFLKGCSHTDKIVIIKKFDFPGIILLFN